MGKLPMRIVTLGDSLTAGFQSPSSENTIGKLTPYGYFLQDLLGENSEILIKGVNGELTSDMLRRIEYDVISLKPDYVIILGGTNDLGIGIEPLKAFEELRKMYERVKIFNIRPISITIPSIRGFDSLIPPRIILNRFIQDYCQSHQQPCVDLFMATAEPESMRLADIYSNDGLHLSTLGYQKISELLYLEVFKNRPRSLDPKGLGLKK